MSETIIINGRSVATSNLSDDASNSNYILIRTKGRPLNKRQKDELKTLEVEIHEFVGDEDDQIYLCGYKPKSLEQIRGLDYVDYANVYDETFVIPDAIQTSSQQTQGTQAPAQNDTIEVDVLLHKDIEDASDDLVGKIAKAAGVEVTACAVNAGFVRLTVKTANLEKIAAIDEVRVVHPVTHDRLFNNVARKILHTPEAKVYNTIYRGENQIICVADTGFDKGSTSDVHDAFTGRVRQLFAHGRPTENLTDDPDGHGTHVCGSVLGSGQHSSQGLIEGTAPAATLIMQSTFAGFDDKNRTQLGIPPDHGVLFAQAYEAGARVHTNSWGTPLPTSGKQREYDTKSESIDQFIWDHQDMTILYAAGNDGQDKDADGNLDGKVNERSLGSQASSKNCITVGACENNRPQLTSGKEGGLYTYGAYFAASKRYTVNPLKDDHMANNPEGLAAFSSRGPTAEGRLKPDVVAPGTAILSTLSRNKKFKESIKTGGESGDDRYWYQSGTSMATPLVAGCCAILREMLLKNGYQDETNGVKNPTGSLIKALLINGAVPLKGQYMPENFGEAPNPHSGFGRVDLAGSMIKPGDENAGYGYGTIVDAEDNDEESITVQIAVPKHQQNGVAMNGAKGLTLKVTLAYADIKGGKLSNDLNLLVVAGNKERHGNQVDQDFNVGTKESFDRRNNVEQIVWPSVPGDSVSIVIRAFRLTSDSVPFAYAWKFY